MRRVLGRAGRALKCPGDERGTLYEIPILVLLLVVSLAVGFGQYERYGWKGLVLGTAIAFAGVVGGIFVLIVMVAGSARLNERLGRHARYPALRSLVQSTLLFLFFSAWGAAFSLLLAGLFEVLDTMPEWVGPIASLSSGGIWMILRRRFKDAFWSLFWRVSGFLGLGGICVLMGMFTGPLFFSNPAALMRFLQIVFFVPLILYVAFLAKKGPRPSGDDQGH